MGLLGEGGYGFAEVEMVVRPAKDRCMEMCWKVQWREGMMRTILWLRWSCGTQKIRCVHKDFLNSMMRKNDTDMHSSKISCSPEVIDVCKYVAEFNTKTVV